MRRRAMKSTFPRAAFAVAVGAIITSAARAAVRDPPAPAWLGALGTSAAITALAPSPDGKLLAAADQREVKLWDLGRQAVVRAIPVERASSLASVPIAFSPDGALLAVGKHLYDAKTGQRLAMC